MKTSRKVCWSVLGGLIFLSIAGGLYFAFWSPFQSPISGFRKPEITAFRIRGGAESDMLQTEVTSKIRGFDILEKRVIPDISLRNDILQEISRKENFGGMGARCFTPGMAFRIQEGDVTVDALVCLECKWLYFFRATSVQQEPLTAEGVNRLTRIYHSLWPASSK